jgi:hypothetical protein
MRYFKKAMLVGFLLFMLPLTAPLTMSSVNAYSHPQPFVPKFTIKYVDHSYDVPTTTTSTMNPYTGEITNTTQGGYRVEKKTVDVIITNEPIPPSNYTYKLFFNVKVKGHFSEDWQELYNYSPFTYQSLSPSANPPEIPQGTCPASDTKYIVLSYHYNEGYQVDFQVQALYGYSTPSIQQHMLFASMDYSYYHGEWSDTQTITVTEPAVTPIPNPKITPTPTPTATHSTQPSTTPNVSPTQNSTTPNQPVTERNASLLLDWRDVAVALLVVAVAGLAFALAWSRIKKL